MVETDYDGSYGYMITDHCIRNGNDLMLGFNSAESNKLTDESATAVLAMRQACKNIMYTVVNSRAYDPENLTEGLMNWQIMAIVIDVIFAALIIFLEVLAIKGFKKEWAAEPIAAVKAAEAQSSSRSCSGREKCRIDYQAPCVQR